MSAHEKEMIAWLSKENEYTGTPHQEANVRLSCAVHGEGFAEKHPGSPTIN